MEDEEEEQRFDNDLKTVALDAELEHDENTEWLRGCEWPTWFTDKPIPGLQRHSALSQGSKSTVIRVEYFVRDTNYAYGVHI
jgi:hypothetical protein